MTEQLLKNMLNNRKRTTVITVCLPINLLRVMNELVKRGYFMSRSEILRAGAELLIAIKLKEIELAENNYRKGARI